MDQVIFSQKARKQLRKLPGHIVSKLQTWAFYIEYDDTITIEVIEVNKHEY